MGAGIPQVITETKASGAQVIDGSLKFNRASVNHLKKTISTTGNQTTFTISGWFKRQRLQDQQYILTSEYVGSGSYFEICFDGNTRLQLYNSRTTNVNLKVDRLLRDTGWFHVVVAADTTQSVQTDRVKIYINGERQTNFDSSGGGNAFPAQNYTFDLVGSRDWYIGTAEFSGSISASVLDGHISNFYFVDGQQLGPENFGS